MVRYDKIRMTLSPVDCYHRRRHKASAKNVVLGDLGRQLIRVLSICLFNCSGTIAKIQYRQLTIERGTLKSAWRILTLSITKCLVMT